MVQTAFHYHLHEKIQHGQATIGKYDGVQPVLTCATTGGKVFLHRPHAQPGQIIDSPITYLNINKQITALAAGCLSHDARDSLLIGTPSTLHCYDVEKNEDVFFKDLSDGVNAICVGHVAGGGDQPLVLAGGNCSIQGFTGNGTDKLWMVTGGNVTAMTLCDINGNGQAELLAGSDDLDIRAFAGEELLAALPEADRFVSLTQIFQSTFGYGLANGTIGVYDRLDRIWRVKSKHSVCALTACDLDGDGIPELVSGWNNGRVEVRKRDTGEVIFRDHISCPVSALLSADYRKDNTMQAIVCGAEGEVRGYMISDARTVSPEPDFSVQQAALSALSQKKQELMYELTSFQNAKDAKVKTDTAMNVIPAATRVDMRWAVNSQTNTYDLILSTNNQCIIRGAVVFGEQLFEEESLFVCPKAPSTQLVIPLAPAKNAPVACMVKVLVGLLSSTSYHIFELDMEVPRFAMFVLVEPGRHTEPKSHVKATLSTTIPRLASYLESRFHYKPTAAEEKSGSLKVTLLCIRDSLPLNITCSTAGAANIIEVNISTDNVDVAGEIISDIASFLGVTEISSTADYPDVMQHCKQLLVQVKEHNTTRQKLATDAADATSAVKSLLIKAEDARILGDMHTMKRYYKKLHDTNRDLIANHSRRVTNHTSLLADLKEINTSIQRMAKLRVGTPQTRVVTACRAAVKADNAALLLRIMRDGEGG